MTCSLRLALVGLVLSIAGCEPQSPAPPTSPATAPAPPVVAPGPAPEPDAPRPPVDSSDPRTPATLPEGPDLPIPAPPAPMTPPFGGEGVRLDQYEFGGIGGFGDRIRVVGDEATLFRWDEEVATAPLTPEEAEALAAIITALAPIERQSDDGPVPDGMASGLFLAGRGTGKDGGEVGRLASRLTERLRALRTR